MFSQSIFTGPTGGGGQEGGVVMSHMAKGAEPDSHRDLKNREEGEDLCPSLYFIATVSENKTSYSHSAVRRSGTAVTCMIHGP